MARTGRRWRLEDEESPVQVEGYTQPEWECECLKMVRRVFGEWGLSARDRERLAEYLDGTPEGHCRSRDPVEAARLRKARQRLLGKVRALFGEVSRGDGVATNRNHSDVTLSGPRATIRMELGESDDLVHATREVDDAQERKKERKKANNNPKRDDP